MTKKAMQARITELETLVAHLNAIITALSTSRTVYVGPVPAQPTVNPLPYPYIPFVSPSYPWGTTICGSQAHSSAQEG